MPLWLGVIAPRVAVVVVIALLTTATITFAAQTRGVSSVPANSQPTAASILLVPDVRGQAYVFAKTSLEEAGFAWRVGGSVQGYAANFVSTQSPAPGSRVYNTGAPTILLGLRVNPRYPLYQHAGAVTSPRLGWWHGAQALEILIRVDRRVEQLWGIGKRSEGVARAALAEVRKKSR